jgi:hypothetical protein
MWMSAGDYARAARAYTRVHDEEKALDACYRCQNLALAEELILRKPPAAEGVGPADAVKLRDDFVSRFAHRLIKLKSAPDSELVEVLSLMSSKAVVRDFLWKRGMWERLAELNKTEGGPEQMREAAQLYERLLRCEAAVQCYGELGMWGDIVRVRLTEATQLLQQLCGMALVTGGNCVSQEATERGVKLEGIRDRVSLAKKVADTNQLQSTEVELWVTHLATLDHPSLPRIQALMDVPFSSTPFAAVPQGMVLLPLLTLAHALNWADAQQGRQSPGEQARLHAIIAQVVKRLRHVADVGLQTLISSGIAQARDSPEFVACAALGRPIGVAHQRADVEMYVLSGVFSLLNMGVQLLVSSQVAAKCHAQREALLASPVISAEAVVSAGDAMVMEAWAIKTLLDMLEQRETVGGKVPEKLKNGTSW